MKSIFLLLSLIFVTAFQNFFAQKPAENIIIITTDGLRWQEVFGGMDSAIANNKKFNQKDSSYILKKYWAAEGSERREKLFPFLWNYLSENGQIYGNRYEGNKVEVSNPYWFSYPGYSEIFCGYVDTLINSNEYKSNPNKNVLEFINQQPGFKNRVAAFGAWGAFDRILNEKRSGFPVVSAFDSCGGEKPNEKERLINAMKKDSYKPYGKGECLDVFTHYAAMEYLKKDKPKVVYISYGETDEWAHAGKYKDYLDAAHQFDAWVKNIWDYLQSDPQYKNNTSLLITTDHGRGEGKKWTSHGTEVPGSNEIWFALMGPNISPQEIWITRMSLFQKQFAQTIASLIGLKFIANHPVADEIPPDLYMPKANTK
jgi:hypothetical protein